MKGDKKMAIVWAVMFVVGVVLITLSMTMAFDDYRESGENSPSRPLHSLGDSPLGEGALNTEGEGTEAPVPGEITRIKLAEGLTLRNVDMVRPEGIESILGMLDVDTYELVDPEHERAVAVLDEASVELEFYAGDELYGMAWVTDGCEVVVIIEGGGVWYTVTSKVDTVLITAEFGRKP